MKLLTTMMIALATASISSAADVPQGTRQIDGVKSTFPEKELDEGIKRVVKVVESCCSNEKNTLAEFNKVLLGEHCRIRLPEVIELTVSGEKLSVTEIVYVPGSYWLRAGQTIYRAAKYDFKTHQAFVDWARQPLTPDR